MTASIDGWWIVTRDGTHYIDTMTKPDANFIYNVMRREEPNHSWAILAFADFPGFTAEQIIAGLTKPAC